MRVIFVPVADRPECANALNTAFSVGQTLGASVIGCHIRPHGHSPVTLPAALGLLETIGEDAIWQANVKRKYGRRSRTAAKDLFARVAGRFDYELLRRPRTKPGAVWMEKTGSPGKVLGIMGPLADMLIVSRPSSTGGNIAKLFLSASLLNSSRPVLILPQTKLRTIGKRICIAWNQSVQAAQIVAAAMPLLALAETVTIVSCGPETGAGPKAAQLSNYLKFWGIKSARVSSRGKDAPKEILAAFKSSNSDLLVMGAYTRGRMHQIIFGGVTRHMLERASIPVLMRHT